MDRETIERVLQQGFVGATDLQKFLGVSQPTLSRWVKKVPNLIRIGETNRSRYALQREIPGLGKEQGLYSIDEEGRILPFGVIKFLAAGQSALLPQGRLFDGYFPPLYDMMPEGFMGRAFAQHFGDELGFPNPLRDWTDQQKLIAIAKRGEDLIGNFMLGRESAERWQTQTPVETSFDQLPGLAKDAMAGNPAGSSAGGEQPKFSIFSGARHHLVKFARKDGTPASKRWLELLACEHHALRVLQENEIPAAQTNLVDSEDFLFLLSERFDRVGAKGRRPLTSLSAVDIHFFGSLQRWSVTAAMLYNSGRLSKTDLVKIQKMEAFSMLIGDNDRHFHNLSLVPDSNFEKFQLAPAYDKLPMYFAPQNGQVLEKSYLPPIPEANLMAVWKDAEKMASSFKERTHFRSFAL